MAKISKDFKRGQKDGNRGEYKPPKGESLIERIFPSKELLHKKEQYEKGRQNGEKQKKQRTKGWF